jgi:hypothetical protein
LLRLEMSLLCQQLSLVTLLLLLLLLLLLAAERLLQVLLLLLHSHPTLLLQAWVTLL